MVPSLGAFIILLLFIRTNLPIYYYVNLSERNSLVKDGSHIDLMWSPNPDLENKTLFPACLCESRQKREKVRGNLIEQGGIASLRSQ